MGWDCSSDKTGCLTCTTWKGWYSKDTYTTICETCAEGYYRDYRLSLEDCIEIEYVTCDPHDPL